MIIEMIALLREVIKQTRMMEWEATGVEERADFRDSIILDEGQAFPCPKCPKRDLVGPALLLLNFAG